MRRPATRLSPRPHRRRRTSNGGQIVVTFAIALSLFLMGLIALVADLSTMFGASALVNQAAQSGAYSAATDVNFATFRTTGVVALNPTFITPCYAAINAAMGTMPKVSLCTNPVPNQVDVTVTATVTLPVNMGLPPQTVSAKYHAYAQQGSTTPGP